MKQQHFSLCFSAFVPLRRHFDARLFLPHAIQPRDAETLKTRKAPRRLPARKAPLYLEDPSSLVLPPWNDIDDSKSQVYASDDNSVPGTRKIALYKSFIFMPKGMAMTAFMKLRII